MKKVFSILVCLLCLLLYTTHVKRHKGFTVDKIQSHHQIDSKYTSAIDPKIIQSILKEPFYYLASGTQSYVFASKTHVIKFFKQKHMRPFSLIEKCLGYYLIPAKRKELNRRLCKHKAHLMSCMLSATRFSKETAFVYMHLSPTSTLNVPIHLIDAHGKTHILDSDSEHYIIQKRGEPVFESIHNWCANDQEESAKKAISSIIDLVITRCKLGIGDADNCAKNFAFIGTLAYEIDISELWDDPGVIYPVHIQAHLETATYDLRKFLLKNYPNLCDYLDQEIWRSIRHMQNSTSS